MKKKKLPLFVSLWLMALFCLPANADQIDYALSFVRDSLQVTQVTVDTVTYSQVTYSGLASSGEAGRPLLPCMYLSFSVPYDAENIAVTTVGTSISTIVLQSPVLPAEQDYFMNDSVIPPLTPDSTVYNTNQIFPSGNALLVSEGYYMGENKVVTVAVYPARCNMSVNRIQLNKSFTVRLTYNRPTGGNPPGNLLVRKSQSLRQQAWDELKQRVVNPNQVEGFAPTTPVVNYAQALLPEPSNQLDSAAVYGGNLYLPNREYEYLIVTTRALRHSFRRLAALKRQKGYNVAVMCLEDILASSITLHGDTIPGHPYAINDSAGKLRQYLRWCYVNRGTRFVLLGGNKIPYRYGTYHYGSSSNNQVCLVPTDMYYSELTSNWNGDNDMEYGELYGYSNIDPGDDIKAEPQLYVGRLFCRNDVDVQNYTNKLLCYELNPGHGNRDYLRKSFYFEHQDQIGASLIQMANLSDAHPYANRRYMNDYYGFPTAGSAVIDLINNIQPGYIGIFAHGYSRGYVVNKISGTEIHVQALDNQSGTGETGNGLDNIDNRYRPAIMYTKSCETMPFDIHTSSSDPKRNCGDSFTSGKRYGGVAYFGATRDTYSDSGKDFANKISEIFIKNNGTIYVGMGESLATTRLSFAGNARGLYMSMVQNLAGEPELSMWQKSPSPYTHCSVNRGDQSIQVTEIRGTSSEVGICSNSNSLKIDAVTQNATVSFDPNSSVMVYSKSKLPFIAPLFIQNTTLSNSQYVIASDYVAGKNVDSGRTAGNVTVANGVEYEVEYSGKVVLAPRFKVEKGAKFTAFPCKY